MSSYHALDGSPSSALNAIEESSGYLRRWQEEVTAQLDAARSEHSAALKEMERLRQESDRWQADCRSALSRAEAHAAELEIQRDLNRRLRIELLDLYRDLRTAEIGPLILRIGMSLTGAERGYYSGPQGVGTQASVGFDDIPAPVQRVLDNYTRQAGQDAAPVVLNDPQRLPDGSEVLNLAAVPVAMKGDMHGVLLVADKRSGPFTDADTDLLLSIGRHAGIALENRRLHHALSESYLSTITVLADAIEAKDPYTRGHCEGVASFALDVARQMGFEGERLDKVRYAALLHDVGKIGISDGILLKPGRLLPEEFSVIKRHTIIGSDLVSRVPALADIAPIILHHHERYDGAGYPSGLRGDDIPLASRIIGAVDAFDAMTSARPYREALSPMKALAELRRCAGEQFDPGVIDVVIELMEERISQETAVRQ